MQFSPAKAIADIDLLEKYTEVRQHTEKLCEPLEIEDYIPQPTVDVSPVKWNIAHTTWFFEEMVLKKWVSGYQVFDPNYAFLFNSYYNSVGDRTVRDNRGDLSRPTVSQVIAYRKYVDTKMREFLANEVSTEIRDLIVLGLNHEQQHQELLVTDLKFTFSRNPLYPAYRPDYFPEEMLAAGTEKYIGIQQGIKRIGYKENGFSFDNEHDVHDVLLQDYEIRDSLVTNAEYLEFIKDGAYSDFNLWHSEGWDWVNQNEVAAPLYWIERDCEWFSFTLGGLRKIEPDAPVCHVSWYEAAAFAEWSGKRLPTEFEWEAANEKFEWGTRWEWTASAYLPYPGFKKAAGAVGEYNGKFMINQMVLRGASAVTPPGHSRPTYRNFFQPHLRWQFTGIRLADWT